MFSTLTEPNVCFMCVSWSTGLMKTDTHVRKLPYVDVIPFGLSNVCRALNNAMRLLHRVASRPAYIPPKAPAEDAIRLQCLDESMYSLCDLFYNYI